MVDDKLLEIKSNFFAKQICKFIVKVIILGFLFIVIFHYKDQIEIIISQLNEIFRKLDELTTNKINSLTSTFFKIIGYFILVFGYLAFGGIVFMLFFLVGVIFLSPFLSLIDYLADGRRYNKIIFYKDSLEIRFIKRKKILYSDIKAIEKGVNYICLIFNDKVQEEKNNIIYNEIILLNNNDEVYTKLKEIGKIKELAIYDCEEKETASIFKGKNDYLGLQVVLISSIVYIISVIFFIIISFSNIFINIMVLVLAIVAYCLIERYVLRKKKENYEFFDNYFVITTNCGSEKINYSYVLRLCSEFREANKCAVQLFYLSPKYKYEKHIYIRKLNFSDFNKLVLILKKNKLNSKGDCI